MLEESDEIGVEHESAFEDTDDNEFDLSVLVFDFWVVLVDLFGEAGDGLAYGLLII